MMRNGMGGIGAERHTFGLGEGAENVEADGFGDIVEKEDADVTV
jgi:hypothetical protein